MTSTFSTDQYASALRSSTSAPAGIVFANGPIDSADEQPQAQEVMTGNIEYVKYAGVRDRIYDDDATTSGNILSLCSVNLEGGAQGMAAEIEAKYPDAWAHFDNARRAGEIERDTVLLVQAARREWDANKGRKVAVFKKGQLEMSRTFFGFIPVKDRFGTREKPVHATVEFARPALEKLAYAAQCGYLHELGITEIRTIKLATGLKQPWSVVAPVMLENLAATGLPVRIYLSAEDTEYDLTTDGQLVERKGQVASTRVVARF